MNPFFPTDWQDFDVEESGTMVRRCGQALIQPEENRFLFMSLGATKEVASKGTESPGCWHE
jgi:hypothetical protein